MKGRWKVVFSRCGRKKRWRKGGGRRFDPSQGLIDSLNYLPDVECGVVVVPWQALGSRPYAQRGESHRRHTHISHCHSLL